MGRMETEREFQPQKLNLFFVHVTIKVHTRFYELNFFLDDIEARKTILHQQCAIGGYRLGMTPS